MDAKPYLLFDETRRISAASPGSGSVLGQPADALLGARCRDAFDCPTCTGEACPIQQAQAGLPAEGLLPAAPDGEALAVTATPVATAGPGMVLVQLKPPDPEQAALGAGLQHVLDGLRTATRSDVGALAFYDETAREIRWQVTSGSVNPDVTGIRLRPGQGFAGRIILTDLPLRTFRFPDDLTDDPGSYPIFLAEGLKAALGVPIHGSDRVLGVLMVASRTERTYTDGDADRLARMAESLGLAAQLMGLYGEAIRAERAKMAHEVHDGLSQNLFGLKLLLFDLQQQQAASPPLRKGIGEVVRLLDSTLVEVRRFIADLRHTSQVQGGLVSALSDYLAHFYRLSQLQVELAIRLEPGEEIVCKERGEVLRVVQEALMNVQRHAGASRVWVEVARADGRCRITISDDGKGFVPDAVGEGHYGLATMRERAVRLQGSLEVQSAPGKGTAVALCFPV